MRIWRRFVSLFETAQPRGYLSPVLLTPAQCRVTIKALALAREHWQGTLDYGRGLEGQRIELMYNVSAAQDVLDLLSNLEG
jgi:hypothetical protein